MKSSPKRVVIRRPGGHDKLLLEECDAPVVGPSDVLIDVAAAGVNYADVVVRMGLYSSAKELVGYPITPGFEVAGVVSAVGDSVTHVTTGDRVFAVTLFGGYAERLTVPSHQVFKLPDALSFEAGAALPTIYLTAYFALDFLAHARKGERVLIHSAAGGVGGMLVQLAKARGCVVTGVVGSSHKVDYAKQLGCDHVIDKATQRLWVEAERVAPHGFDLILDANGTETLRQGYKHLATPGKLVVYGFSTMMSRGHDRPNYFKLALDFLRMPRFSPLDMTNRSKSVMAFNLSYLFERRDILEEAMQSLYRQLDKGDFQVPSIRSFALADVADAHRALESGKTTGKLVLSC